MLTCKCMMMLLCSIFTLSHHTAAKLTQAMTRVSDWLAHSCLNLNLSKTVCMYFTTKTTNLANPEILINGEVITSVTHVKSSYLSQTYLSKKQVKRVIRNVKFGLSNLRSVRHQLSQPAEKFFVHTMIFPHLSYCITTWSQEGVTTLKPVYSLYKQIVKVLDKKSRDYHHCNILKKYNLLSFKNFVLFSDACLMFKIR